MADAGDKQNGRGARREPPKPDPPGYFEGESMTRRRAFTIAAQGARRRRRRRRSSCPPSASPSRRSSTAARSAGRRSARPATSSPTPTARSSSPRPRDRRRRQDHRLRAPGLRADLGEDPDEFIAVSNRCAHLGCPVRFVEAAGNFICPCHGGVYDFQGKRIGGPPVRPLDQLPDPGPRAARSRSAPATASPPSSSRSAPATPASSPAASGNTSTRRVPRPSRRPEP